MKNPQVLISEGDVLGNKGAMAMVDCIVKGVKEKHPLAKFYITSQFQKTGKYKGDPNISIINCSNQNIDIPLVKVWIYWILKKIGINTRIVKNDKILSIYNNTDLIVSASGISFIDNFGTRKIYHFSKFIQIPLFLNKRVIKFTQSIGPFNTSYNRIMAKLTLKRLDKVFARGKNSEKNLAKIGIYKNVEILPDIAVTLEPNPIESMVEFLEAISSKTVIGISPNIVCKRLENYENYVPSLKLLVNHILTKYKDVEILLIPHTIEKSLLNKDDDFSICKEIYDEFKENKNISIVDTLELSAEQAKWLISKCDFFIGSRFHSLIAAISSAVPSIAIGWHWKYEEMMKWVKQNDNLIYHWDLTKDKLVDLFENNFSKRDKIKKELENIIPTVKLTAMRAIERINDLLCEND